VLLVVAPARLVDVVVGKTSVVVDACVLVVVDEPPPLVVDDVDVVGVVVVEPPGCVVGVVVVEPPGTVVTVVVVDPPGCVGVDPPGMVEELGFVVPKLVVVVVTPTQVHAVQRSPHGPRPPSHSSPPASSQMPSPHRLSVARNGFAMPADFAVNVPLNERHC